MRQAFGMLGAIVFPVAALGQSMAPITATPLMPPSVQYPTSQQPPQVMQQVQPLPQPGPTTPQQGAQAPGQGQQVTQPPVDQSQAQPPAAPQPMRLTWLPEAGATLQVLDKVNALSSTLTIKVGQQAQVGSLNIQVQACDVHPPDQPRDSAAYLTITDSHPDEPGFHGWMLANDPSLSMLQHPLYDVRVIGCQT